MLAAGVLAPLGVAQAATPQAAPDPVAPTTDTPVDALWTPSAARPRRGTTAAPVTVRPEAYRGYTLDAADLRDQLAAAPLAGSRGAARQAVEVVVPAPTGELVTFAVVESPVMESELQAKYPDIRTYAGNAVGDATDSIRLDVTPQGFHAAVRGDHPSWYVDPSVVGEADDDTLYLSYFGEDLPERQQPLVEPNFDELENAAVPEVDGSRGSEAGGVVTQRSYRLALLTDPAYAEYVAPGLNDGTQDAASNAAVLAAKVTMINRVDQIYNADMGIELVLINGTDALNLNNLAKSQGANGPCGLEGCFSAGQLDAGCTGTLLTRQRLVIGLLAGAQNYDVGHLALGINGGGIAQLGVVGKQNKARGCTGLPFPVGDFMAIDYVAHEIGHQFAGNHTFTSPNECGATNRNADTAVEPGSGSSVMAYAGICATDDLQPHTDPYFSFATQDEVFAYVEGGPASLNEVQAVGLRNFDGTDSFTLTFDGIATVPIVRGTNYTAAGVKAAVETVLGGTATVSAFFGSGSFDDRGFNITWSGAKASTNVPNPVVVPVSGDVTGTGNDIDKGGATTHGGFTAEATANHNPTVTALDDVTIPVQTPFTLSGSATDADDDPLVYLWEQVDAGGLIGLPLVSNAKSSGPLFRVFGTYADVSLDDSLLYNSPGQNLATSSPERRFPDLDQVLAGATNADTGSCPVSTATDSLPNGPVLDCYSEFLPTPAYLGDLFAGNADGSLTFRLTARDQQPGGGGTSYDEVTLGVNKLAGPFLVTSQASGETYAGGSTQTVEWDTALTDTLGLADEVKISLSLDGGQTFDTVLTETTANDGSEDVVLPDLASTEARIMIEAVDNIFYDVNDAPFTITSENAVGLEVSDDLPATVDVDYSDAVPTGTISASSGLVDGDAITANASGLPDGLTLTRGTTSATSERPGTTEFVLGGTADVDPGSYPVTVDVTDGTTTEQVAFTVAVAAESASATYTGDTSATAPSDGTVEVTLSASVAEGADGSPGDLTTATATFRDGTTDLCAATVSSGGAASCTADLAPGTYDVSVVVGGRYTGSSAGTTALVVDSDGGEEPPGDTRAPVTSIIVGPDQGSILKRDRTTFAFRSDEAGSTFYCSLDGTVSSCLRVLRLRDLSAGTHRLRVSAVDEAGNIDRTPASRVFTVPRDSTVLKAKGRAWSRKAVKRAYGGSVVRTNAKGAVLVTRVREARGLALLVARNQKSGKVKVFVGKKLVARRSLAGKKGSNVLVTLRRNGKPLTGRVRIVTTTKKPVAIGALAVVTRP